MDFSIRMPIGELPTELGVQVLSLAFREFDEVDETIPVTLEYRDKEIVAIYGDTYEEDNRYASFRVVETLSIVEDLLEFPENRKSFDDDDILIISRDAHDQGNVIFRLRRL